MQKEKINKVKVFFKALFYPIQDSFFVWWEVVQGKENPERFWEDISFFHLFNEDFFEWYDFDMNTIFMYSRGNR